MNEYQKIKHKNSKEILELKDFYDVKKHNRKITFVNVLYDLKNKFLDKEQKYKIDRFNLSLSRMRKLKK